MLPLFVSREPIVPASVMGHAGWRIAVCPNVPLIDVGHVADHDGTRGDRLIKDKVLQSRKMQRCHLCIEYQVGALRRASRYFLRTGLGPEGAGATALGERALAPSFTRGRIRPIGCGSTTEGEPG